MVKQGLEKVKGNFNQYPQKADEYPPAKAYTLEVKIRKALMAELVNWPEKRIVDCMDLRMPESFYPHAYVLNELCYDLPVQELDQLTTLMDNKSWEELLRKLKAIKPGKSKPSRPQRLTNATLKHGSKDRPQRQKREGLRDPVSEAPAQRSDCQERCDGNGHGGHGQESGEDHPERHGPNCPGT